MILQPGYSSCNIIACLEEILVLRPLRHSKTLFVPPVLFLFLFAFVLQYNHLCLCRPWLFFWVSNQLFIFHLCQVRAWLTCAFGIHICAKLASLLLLGFVSSCCQLPISGSLLHLACCLFPISSLMVVLPLIAICSWPLFGLLLMKLWLIYLNWTKK